MSNKKSLLWFAVLVLLVLSSTSVYAYINNINTAGPDIWLNPGYRWNLNADTAFGQSVCIQWSTDGGVNWDRNRCSALGGDSWQCDIPNNLNSSTVKFQFYKDAWDDNCAIGGNEWEWTAQWTFTTGPTAVTLQSLSATASVLPLAGAAIAALGGLGGLALWRRRR